MSAAPPRVIQVRLAHLVLLGAAIVVVAALTPAGVMAATGSYVNIRDAYNTGVTGHARVVNNRLAGTTCDSATNVLSSSTCARVTGGKVAVGDAGTLPARPWSTHVELYNSGVVGGPFAAGSKLAISSISVYLDSPSNAIWWFQAQDAPTTGGCPALDASTKRGIRLNQYLQTHDYRQLTFPVPLVAPFTATASRWCLYGGVDTSGYRIMMDVVGFVG
jgi:hypothetical protein